MLPETLYIQGTKYNKAPSLPEGYSLYQCGDDYQVFGSPRSCASGGCPAVVTLPDEVLSKPDTIFTEQWQYYVYAINLGMNPAAIIAIMGDGKALMNNTGFGDPENPRANYLTGKNLDQKPPRLDKFRTFNLATHAFKPVNNKLLILAMDGNQSPLLKPGRTYPKSVAEINPDDYLYLPQTHRWLFMDCSNVKIKPDQSLDYGPWANGIQRSWIEDNRMHTFFPLVSQFSNYCLPEEWNKIPAGSSFPSPFR